MKYITSYDQFVGDTVKRGFTDIKKSKTNSAVYYQVEFVQLKPLGEETPTEKEFPAGQSESGMHGFYRAYIYIPAYWKFSSLGLREMGKEVSVYGGRFVYKNIKGADDTSFSRYNCIGWSYYWGLEDECFVSRDDIGRDISGVIQDITDWEWENEPDIILIGTISSISRELEQFVTAVKHLPKEQKEDNKESFIYIHNLIEGLNKEVGKWSI